MSSKTNEPRRLTETDLAQDKMGDNALQGNDQAAVHTQRHAVAGVKKTPDDSVRESLEKMDKDVRARRELGKRADK
ncbi:MAG: hypothetical protein Q8K28_19750 [Hoeflea sp.]|uniref:hypothetical protein n=1 Tax=Hoeflea sp. TaxID=1940281 RepID=UPI002730EA76|nr:hypothetical protein [Hoeflea sp.]MDP2122140.1 hypothetical protein [Hoeflea sp.]